MQEPKPIKAPITDEEFEALHEQFKGLPIEDWPEDPNYFQEIWEELERI